MYNVVGFFVWNLKSVSYIKLNTQIVILKTVSPVSVSTLNGEVKEQSRVFRN
jgi:hypothetical protein